MMEIMDDPELEHLRHEVKAKRDSLAEKIQQIEQNVVEQAEAVVNAGETVAENVTHAFDISYQVRQRPWIAIGASVLAGYLAGRVIIPSSSDTETRRRREEDYPERPGREYAVGDGEHREESESSPIKTYLRSILDEIGDVATSAATGVLMQVAQSMLSRPSDQQQQGNAGQQATAGNQQATASYQV